MKLAGRTALVTGASRAMTKWANDYVGMPGRFFSQITKELYFKNALLKNEFTIRGQRVDLRHIH